MNVSEAWNKFTYVIPEPVEIDFIKPGNRPKKELTALWFGHNSNLAYLFEFMANRMHLAPPKNLIIFEGLHRNIDSEYWDDPLHN